MAYDDIPGKPIEVLDARKDKYACPDVMIERASLANQYGVRTDAAAEGVGYLGMDDIDRIRRKNLKHRTR